MIFFLRVNLASSWRETVSSPGGGWSEQEARAVNPEQRRGLMLWDFYFFFDQPTLSRITA